MMYLNSLYFDEQVCTHVIIPVAIKNGYLRTGEYATTASVYLSRLKTEWQWYWQRVIWTMTLRCGDAAAQPSDTPDWTPASTPRDQLSTLKSVILINPVNNSRFNHGIIIIYVYHPIISINLKWPILYRNTTFQITTKAFLNFYPTYLSLFK